MPRIRLRIDDRTEHVDASCRYVDNGVQVFPVLRLATLAVIEKPPVRLAQSKVLDACVRTILGQRPGTQTFPPGALRNALIDTGAWISAVEPLTWVPLYQAGLIEHLPFDREPAPALIGGRESAYQLGRLHISLVELAQPMSASSRLPSVPVLAMLLLNPECESTFPIVLGLHHGVLDGRRLVREPVWGRDSGLSTDSGARYGQEWYLETV